MARFIFILSIILLSFTAHASVSSSTHEPKQESNQQQHNQWLKDQFEEKHYALIPLVSIADMLYGCNLERKTLPSPIPVKLMVKDLNPELLSEQLATCLGEDTVQSSTAVNFGIVGCFHDVMSELSANERQDKMTLVTQLIAKLSQEELKKSFIKCVTEQTINYL